MVGSVACCGSIVTATSSSPVGPVDWESASGSKVASGNVIPSSSSFSSSILSCGSSVSVDSLGFMVTSGNSMSGSLVTESAGEDSGLDSSVTDSIVTSGNTINGPVDVCSFVVTSTGSSVTNPMVASGNRIPWLVVVPLCSVFVLESTGAVTSSS